jgi:hypothetical protein
MPMLFEDVESSNEAALVVVPLGSSFSADPLSIRSLLRAAVTDISLKEMSSSNVCMPFGFGRRNLPYLKEEKPSSGTTKGSVEKFIPCRLPSDSNESSMELAGLFVAIAVWGLAERVMVDWLNAIEVCGRLPYEDGGRAPGPTLLAKLEFDAVRDDAVREDTEDAKEVLRAPLAPTSDVPFTVGRVLMLPAMDVAERAGSPARSTRVLRFGCG